MRNSLYLVANVVSVGGMLGPSETRVFRIVAPSMSEAVRLAALQLGSEAGTWSAKIAEPEVNATAGIEHAYAYQAAA
jgi:hypothetical protein